MGYKKHQTAKQQHAMQLLATTDSVPEAVVTKKTFTDLDLINLLKMAKQLIPQEDPLKTFLQEKIDHLIHIFNQPAPYLIYQKQCQFVDMQIDGRPISETYPLLQEVVDISSRSYMSTRDALLEVQNQLKDEVRVCSGRTWKSWITNASLPQHLAYMKMCADGIASRIPNYLVRKMQQIGISDTTILSNLKFLFFSASKHGGLFWPFGQDLIILKRGICRWLTYVFLYHNHNPSFCFINTDQFLSATYQIDSLPAPNMKFNELGQLVLFQTDSDNFLLHNPYAINTFIKIISNNLVNSECFFIYIYEPRVLPILTTGHVCGIKKIDNIIQFFDPNLGIFCFLTNGDFIAWLECYFSFLRNSGINGFLYLAKYSEPPCPIVLTNLGKHNTLLRWKALH